MNKFIRTRKLKDLLLCFIIVSIPTTCIFIGLAISNHFAPLDHSYSDREVIADVTRLNYSWHNSHNVTMHFVGGLGNQMFQYASLFGIAKANGLKPLVDGKRNKLVGAFSKLHGVETDEEELKKIQTGLGYLIYRERKSNAFENRAFSLNFMKNIQLVGFFQSWRYFDHVRSQVKQQMSSFKPRIAKKVNDFLASILSSHAMLGEDQTGIKFVGIHVRRGDFLEKSNVEKGYGVADSYFYKRAMQFFLQKFKNVVFVVCSDDRVWSEERIRSSGQGSLVVHSKFSNFTDPAYDLKLLASCNHTIFSGSTFGWWGAWLSGGLVVYNQDFPRPDSPLAEQFRLSDYYLPQWLPM